jgi:hypothetical protein
VRHKSRISEEDESLTDAELNESFYAPLNGEGDRNGVTVVEEAFTEAANGDNDGAVVALGSQPMVNAAETTTATSMRLFMLHSLRMRIPRWPRHYPMRIHQVVAEVRANVGRANVGLTYQG